MHHSTNAFIIQNQSLEMVDEEVLGDNSVQSAFRAERRAVAVAWLLQKLE